MNKYDHLEKVEIKPTIDIMLTEFDIHRPERHAELKELEKNNPEKYDIEIEQEFEEWCKENERVWAKDRRREDIINGKITITKEDIFYLTDKGQTKLSHKNAAEFLMQENHFITVGDIKFEIYYFNGKTYIPGGDKFIATKTTIITSR